MLSVSAMSAGQGAYYTGLAREDYYLEGGEPPGQWLGRGAERLGLLGIVTREVLENLFDGFSPDGRGALVQIQRYQDGRSRQPGWDLTFSAPKSVSVFWSQASPEVRQVIQDAHFEAVQAAIAYLEDNAAFSRRGKAGEGLERAGLVAALFEHGTSRAQDPQLHSHVLVLNVGSREDGTFGAIRSKDIYQHQMVAGALYRTELTHQLAERLGLSFEKVERWFEVKGVPQDLIDTFSKRRAIIEEVMAERGLTGAKSAEFITVSTRQVKDHVAREELFQGWQEIGRAQGFDPASLVHQEVEPMSVTKLVSELRRVTGKAIQDVVQGQSHFAERDILRRVLEQTQHLGVGAELTIEVVRAQLADRSKVLDLGVHDGHQRFTTPEMYRVEESLLQTAERLQEKSGHVAATRHIEDALVKRPTIRHEQREALRFITESPGDMKCVVGMAGTGKTYLLDAAREIWEGSGFTVLGAALAGKAARGLQDASGIPSRTIESLLRVIDPPMKVQLEHAARQMKRAAQGKKTYALEGSPLDKNTVLVVDEAGMVDSRRLEKLLSACEASGAMLVLVGDDRQLQPIEAGGPFGSLAVRHGAAELRDITRQHDEWAKQAVHQFADGDARGALSQYRDAGLLDISPTKKDAIAHLIETWGKERTRTLKETLILAGTNADVADLNKRAQQIRVREGELRTDSAYFRGTERLLVGDRVLFTRNDRTLGVSNGDFGTVFDIAKPDVLGRVSITVALDRTQPGLIGVGAGSFPVLVTIDPTTYEDFRLGYAATTHKSQGATVDRAFVLAGGWMQDRELSYVEMSRAREFTRVFTTETDAGEDLCELAQTMSRSHQKGLAHDLPAEVQFVDRGMSP